MLFVVAFISVWLLVFKCFCFLGHFVYLVCCAGFPFVGAVLIGFVAIVWFALRGMVDLNLSIYLFLLFVVVFFSVWLLIFKYFCFLLYFVYLVCCVGFPFVGAVLVTFVVIVWFALRGRVDLNMSNFSCLLLLFYSVCGYFSLDYLCFCWFTFTYFCLLFLLLFISLFTFVNQPIRGQQFHNSTASYKS